ncbi:response regulator [Nocardia inohanensis]|uniref:response regulator n=1 Tax=Nocardia inohanensis TaxID=209246 RepID=UPI001FE13B1A|nr:response regulator transcription factor [Nocardia inohanensis]
MVIDDEALVRSGFALILNQDPDLEVVATADGREAIAAIERHRPDVVLLDIRMPEVDGLAVLRAVARGDHTPAVAMLTTFDADEYVLQALRLGAAGYLLKDTDPHQLASMVKTLAAGGVVLSSKVTVAVIAQMSTTAGDSATTAAVGTLSERERTVLRLIAGGASNPEIAAAIQHSVGTVKDDVSAILAKLGVGTRVEAALIAQQAGLLEAADG